MSISAKVYSDKSGRWAIVWPDKTVDGVMPSMEYEPFSGCRPEWTSQQTLDSYYTEHTINAARQESVSLSDALDWCERLELL